MRVAYLDPVCGISGDMFVACFLDAGLPLEKIRTGLDLLPLEGYEISSTKIVKNSISATRFIVDVPERQHEHRTLRSISSLIDGSGLPAKVKERALGVFRLLAEAEGEVHGISPEDVAFHEVGAVDSIVDIVASAIAMETMGIEKLMVGPLPAGRGTVQTAHGPLPVPVPATVKLLKGFEIQLTDIRGELVTPTGAAIVSAYGKPLEGAAPALKIKAVGSGAGARDVESVPNIARLFVGELANETGSRRPVDVLETTVDDASPELLGYLASRLLEAGAHDTFMTPVVMKKSRPGVLLTVLSPPGKTEELVGLVFRETPTLGIRVSHQYRYELEREIESVGTKYGEVPMKISTDGEGRRRGSPEYEVCASIARTKGLPFLEVWEEARRVWEKSQEA